MDETEEQVGAGFVDNTQLATNMRRDLLARAGYVESSTDVWYSPISPLNESNCIEFVVPPIGLTYIDLKSTRLYGKLKIVKLNNKNEEVPLTTALTKTIPPRAGSKDPPTTQTIYQQDDVSFINLLPKSCFKLVSVDLNSTACQNNSTYYLPYKGFFETLMSFSKEQKEYFLRKSCLYIPDKAGSEDANNKNASPSSGYVKRSKLVGDDKDIEFFTPIHADIFMSRMLLIPGITMRVKFYKQDDAFVIMAPTDDFKYKIKFQELSLVVKTVTLRPDIAEKHSNSLLRQPLRYIFPQGRVTSHTITPDTNSTFIQNLASGILPSLVIVGLVSSESMSGSYRLNPWTFSHWDVNQFFFRVNGNPRPSRVYEPDYTPGRESALREYLDMVRQLNLDSDPIVPISFEEFISGSNFYVLDLSGEASQGYTANKEKFGSLDAYISFRTSTTRTLKLVVYSIYRQTVTIDKDRNVHSDM